MKYRHLPVGLALVLGMIGCLSLEKTPLELQPMPPETLHKVATLGQQIQQKNPDLPVKVTCSIIGKPDDVEIFSQVSGEHCAVYLTLGLIRKCKTDGQLAAIICQEVGKAVSQHIGQANLAMQQRMEQNNGSSSVSIGNDIGGRFGPTGGTLPPELARQDKLRQLAQQPLAAPPPPDSLARIYLTKAGFNPHDLELVQPVLRDAARNTALEKQMTPPWWTQAMRSP